MGAEFLKKTNFKFQFKFRFQYKQTVPVSKTVLLDLVPVPKRSAITVIVFKIEVL